jgi:hypothetical protein
MSGRAFVAALAVAPLLAPTFYAAAYGVERKEFYRGRVTGIVNAETHPAISLDLDQPTTTEVEPGAYLPPYGKRPARAIVGWVDGLPLVVSVTSVEHCVEWHLRTTPKDANPSSLMVLSSACD